MYPYSNDMRLSLYKNTVALLQFMKNMMAHVIWERLKKEEGGKVHVQCWKDHYAKTNHLNMEVYAILSTLGI